MAKEMEAIWGYLECRKVDDAQAQAKIRDLEQAKAEAEQRICQLTDRLPSKPDDDASV